MKSANEVIAALSLQPLAGEGGMWAPIFNNGEASAIYFLMVAPDFSAWHRIPEQEMWIHIAGSPTALYTLDEQGTATKTLLDNSAGMYQYIVKPQQWMAAKPIGAWSLLICSLTPAFTSMELADRTLSKNWQAEAPLVAEIGELFHD